VQVLSNTTLLEGMSAGNRKTLERVLKRVVELLEAGTLTYAVAC
jgi:hypothetical protein